MKLYFVPMTRSIRPRWMLEELGIPYDLAKVDVADGENKKPEYLAIHPMGQVPALVDGDETVFESAAICMQLADKFPEKGMAPGVGTAERGQYYQWILFVMATLEPAIFPVFGQLKLPAGERDQKIIEANTPRLMSCLGILDHTLREREFLVGESFTAADVVVASVIAWAKSLGFTADFPAAEAYAVRMLARPAAKRARGS